MVVKRHLRDIDSDKGYGLLGPSYYVTEAANEAEEEGKSDAEIIRAAVKAGQEEDRSVSTILGTAAGASTGFLGGGMLAKRSRAIPYLLSGTGAVVGAKVARDHHNKVTGHRALINTQDRLNLMRGTKQFSLKRKDISNREVVPEDIAERGKIDGVIQKDKKGVWRIISYKTDPPTFWPAHYETRESAEKALRGYQYWKRK